MAVTYTRAGDRPALAVGIHDRARTGQFALVAVTIVSAAALFLTSSGRMRALELSPGSPPASVVNLNAAPTDGQLQAVTSSVFTHPADAAFAAHALTAALEGATRAVPNVGALAALETPVAAIDRTRGLRVFAERVRAARERGASPVSIRLFTAADISAMKPRLVVRTADAYRSMVRWYVLAILVSFQFISLVWRARGLTGDRLLLAAVHLLVTLGAMAMISRADPLRDTMLLARYAAGVATAAAACAAISLVNVRTSAILQLNYLALGAALVLSVALAAFGSGPGTSGAKVNLGPWQPIELIRLLLVVFLAGYLGRRWELLRQVRETSWHNRPLPNWLHVPRAQHVLPMLGGVSLALALFFLLRDLGPALLVSLLLLLLLSVARAGAGALVGGLVLLGAGFCAGYWLDISPTLTARVAMWHSPWDNAIRGGDQVAQALWALATGALTGTGPGLGDTRYLPAGHTDLVMAAIGEELGLAGLLVMAAAAGVLAWRGLRIAREAPTDGAFFLALGLTLSLVVPMLVMAGGTLGLIPLTGVVTPFLSYGGSAMLANFVAVGLLAAVASRSGTATAVDLRPFHAPLRWLSAGLAAAALVIGAGWARVQAWEADAVLVRPQSSRQADGAVRYQFNPRVLDAARSVPRGAIRDRRDVPLAAGAADIAAAGKELARLDLAPPAACAHSDARCYPLGGRAFHLVGDADSRLNWGAGNSSYVERDAEDALRGFDRRSALVPLVRHRWEPSHPDVVAIRNRSRDVRLTIDARLQMKVSSILARTAAGAGVDKAAAVVLDAASGEMLASVSYPWPAAGNPAIRVGDDSLLDRARYGLYPPGSTFKLVTAAAALRTDPTLGQLPFACTRLPNQRVGVRIPGLGRPIRDDVLDRHPHGTLRLGEALVHSCNAYFAQLALRLGTEPLAATARSAGMVFPDDRDGDAEREQLAHAGYGQGEVLTTPLRMARVVAAIASDGMLREPALVSTGAPSPEPKAFLPTSSAHRLAGYLRDAVTHGTGRSVRGNPLHVAGKTGTAQLDNAPSHSWFVGYAPAVPGGRRIAFAVILENAGYGSGAAADVASQIVTAASTLEIIK